MLSNYLRLYNTVKFLKFEQIAYRLYYFSRNRIRTALGENYKFSKSAKVQTLKLQKSIHIRDVYLGKKKFEFLNLNKKFDSAIDWNFDKHGKLWTYNLTYFDYLSQSRDKDELLELIYSFIESIPNMKDGLEPFPISLRGMNWIKFLSYNHIRNQKIDDSLYAQYHILLDNLEYHLLGNHLLENAFSLLFGAYYFEDETFYLKSKKILNKELNIQILRDGAHFELTPMYHQIMLFRLLDCINLLKNNRWQNDDLLDFLIEKSELMLGWLEHISYENGDIPLLNDSTNGIAPHSLDLYAYAKRLNLTSRKILLSESGYRKIKKNSYEMTVDVGEIGAKFIPGHAHADTLNFELRVKGRPFIVDVGLSTYETSQRRVLERSTKSHNTVECLGISQSDVWGGFRVANRASIVKLDEKENYISAIHNGYKKLGCLHTRTWKFYNNRIIIEDNLSRRIKSISRLHFHPSVTKEDIYKYLLFDVENSSIEQYHYSPEFNTHLDAFVLEIEFEKEVNIEILI